MKMHARMLPGAISVAGQIQTFYQFSATILLHGIPVSAIFFASMVLETTTYDPFWEIIQEVITLFFSCQGYGSRLQPIRERFETLYHDWRSVITTSQFLCSSFSIKNGP